MYYFKIFVYLNKLEYVGLVYVSSLINYFQTPTHLSCDCSLYYTKIGAKWSILHIHYTRRLLVSKAWDHTSKKYKTSAMW